MVKNRIFKILIIGSVLLFLMASSVSAKTYHFGAFVLQETVTQMGSWPTSTMYYMVSAMQKLEYNNYHGTNNYNVTSSKQDVMNYIGLNGKNYGLAIVSHGAPNYLQWVGGQDNIYGSEITGNWHLVLLNACSACTNNTLPNAFKTVGYSHRATVGFNDDLYVDDALEFWQAFDSVICSSNLNTVVNYAINMSGAPAVLWGDRSWNGYAWY